MDLTGFIKFLFYTALIIMLFAIVYYLMTFKVFVGAVVITLVLLIVAGMLADFLRYM